MSKEFKKNPIQEIIEKSGNGFHYKVVNHLRNNGWTVLVSPYYNDNITDKPREIDIVAEKEFDIIRFGRCLGTINVKFFIECKYINNEIVFWFDSTNKDDLIKRIMVDTGLKPPTENISIKEHRYMTIGSVAKLFSSKIDKSQENEIIYKALNQSLNAMVYYKNSPSIIPENINKIPKILKTLNYSVIICNNFNKLYKINSLGNNNPEIIVDNFHLELNYAYFDSNKKSISEYFLVDIVDFDKLDNFLKEVEDKDVKTVGAFLSDQLSIKQLKLQQENNQPFDKYSIF